MRAKPSNYLVFQLQSLVPMWVDITDLYTGQVSGKVSSRAEAPGGQVKACFLGSKGTFGIWCNWQHIGFWYRHSRFESWYPSSEI